MMLTQKISLRHLAAWHEAGHVAALWFLGALDLLHSARIADDGAGQTLCWMTFTRPALELAKLPRPLAAAYARRGALFYLAGHCAELHHLRPEAGESWLLQDGFFAEREWEGHELEDYQRATVAAAAACGAGAPAREFITMVSRWTWRCLALPEVAAIADRVAIALGKRGRLTRRDVRCLAPSSAVAAAGPPYLRFGAEWRQWLAFPWNLG